MTSFKDKTGQAWDIDLTFNLLASVKSRLGICIVDLTEEDRKANRAETDVRRVADDLPLFIDLLYVLCEEQATERSLDSRAFGKLQDTESAMEAMAALHEEYLLFSLPRSHKDRGRKLAKERAARIRAETDAAMSKGLAELEKADSLTDGSNLAGSTSPTS